MILANINNTNISEPMLSVSNICSIRFSNSVKVQTLSTSRVEEVFLGKSIEILLSKERILLSCLTHYQITYAVM